MLDDNSLRKLESFFNESLVEQTLKKSIIRNENNSYTLFDRYIITNDIRGYRLEFKNYHNYKTFYTLKNAFVFAMLDVKNKMYEGKRLEQIDRKLASLDFEIANLNNKLRKTNTKETKIIYDCKLSDDLAKKHSLLRELEKYEKLAKSYYHKAYNLKG